MRGDERSFQPEDMTARRRKDGRYFKAACGSPMCFAWNAGYCGKKCSMTGILHICEFCGGADHRAVQCKDRPEGWEHPWLQTPEGKAATTKGNGKPKGGGKPTGGGGAKGDGGKARGGKARGGGRKGSGF